MQASARPSLPISVRERELTARSEVNSRQERQTGVIPGHRQTPPPSPQIQGFGWKLMRQHSRRTRALTPITPKELLEKTGKLLEFGKRDFWSHYQGKKKVEQMDSIEPTVAAAALAPQGFVAGPPTNSPFLETGDSVGFRTRSERVARRGLPGAREKRYWKHQFLTLRG